MLYTIALFNPFHEYEFFKKEDLKAFVSALPSEVIPEYYRSGSIGKMKLQSIPKSWKEKGSHNAKLKEVTYYLNQEIVTTNMYVLGSKVIGFDFMEEFIKIKDIKEYRGTETVIYHIDRDVEVFGWCIEDTSLVDVCRQHGYFAKRKYNELVRFRNSPGFAMFESHGELDRTTWTLKYRFIVNTGSG